MKMDTTDYRTRIEKMIIEKAMKDETFRNKLIHEPRLTLEQELGATIPEAITINILEETPDTFFLVLPSASSAKVVDELMESELAQVSGGTNETETGAATGYSQYCGGQRSAACWF